MRRVVMTETVAFSLLLMSIGWVITAIASLISVIIGIQNAKDIKVVKHNTNSLTSQLVKASGESGFAAGQQSERDRDKGV
jgi:uncharacterized membrane protein